MGRASGRTYYGGDNAFDKFADVDPRDVEYLVSLGVWEVVRPPKPAAVIPRAPAAVAAPDLPTSNGVERPMLDLTNDMEAEALVNVRAAALAKQTRDQK